MTLPNHELDEDGPNLNPYYRRFQILSLSGGGFRGLFTAHVLENLEHRYGNHKEHFDLFAGTSIGAILAGALSVGVSAQQCREAMEEFGAKIFPPAGRVKSKFRWVKQLLFQAPYSTEYLSSAIKNILGDKADLQLSAIDTPLLIPCVSHTRANAIILMSKGLARDGGSQVTLHDAMLASAAAPTFFPARKLAEDVIIDGGVIANSPELVAITMACEKFGAHLDDQFVLSIGTACPSLARPAEDASSPGVVGWMTGRKLFQVTMEAQSRLTEYQCSTLLGGRYLKLDATASPEQASVIGLDKADKVASRTLANLAATCWETWKNNRELEAMYGHQATR